MTKKLLLSLLFGILGVGVYGQTIKTLGFNTTNGHLVTATNVIWTNAFNFSTNTVAAQVRTNLGLSAAWLTNTNAGTFRGDIGLGWSALTNSNAATGLIGYTVTNGDAYVIYNADAIYFTNGLSANTFGSSYYSVIEGGKIVFEGDPSPTRTNLGLGGGITTNRTFISYDGTNYTTNSVTISNGIITGWTQ